MLDSIWEAIADELSGERARDLVARLWQHARWNSFDRMRDTAEQAAAILRETGLQDVQVLEFPADGVTAYGGWVLPQAWDVDDATLEIVEPAVPDPVLAHYRECPQNLMMWSAPTPPEGIEAEVVLADAGGRCDGKIVLADGVGLDVGRDAFERGAIGVISDHIKLAGSPQDKGDGHFDHAAQWHNYTIPLWKAARKGFGFSISPTQGRRLRALLSEHGTVRLRAVVRTRLYDGALPCVTGLLPGRTAEEIVLTGHLFEPGANDNASGPALGMECIRTIRSLCDQGKLPPLERGLRPVFTFEVRGYQAFLATWEHLGRIVAGINLDMVGNDLTDARARANLVYNFPSMPAYTDFLALELLERLKREDDEFQFKTHPAGALVDNLFGEPSVGAPMCVLGCWPDAYYHNSLDVLDTISPTAMAQFGRMVGTYCAFLATAGFEEAMWLADLVARHAERELADEDETAREKNAARLRSIARLVRGRSIVPTREGLEEAGEWLSPETHLFRDEELRRRLDEMTDTLPRGEKSDSPAEVDDAQAERAQGLAPVRTFKGSLCLESLDEEALAEFESKTGIGLGWGAPHWLQLALFRANGKRCAWDIYQWLGGEVSAPDLERFNNCIELLARHGFVRLRPVLDEAHFLAAFESVGVPHAETVLVHSSLSDFGYVSGGAATVIAALRKAIGPQGTLAMPALSCSWVGRPPFDREATPTHVGAVPEAFRQMQGVLRSGHPSHSVAACGPRADEIVAIHDPERPVFAPESPWGKLYDLDAWILMLCKLASNTAMHMGEERNGLLRTDLVAHVVEGGERGEVPITHAPRHVNFDRNYELLRQRGQIQSAQLGEGTIHLMRFRHAVDAATENTAKDPLLATGGERCECTFCANIRAYLARTS